MNAFTINGKPVKDIQLPQTAIGITSIPAVSARNIYQLRDQMKARAQAELTAKAWQALDKAKALAGDAANSITGTAASALGNGTLSGAFQGVAAATATSGLNRLSDFAGYTSQTGAPTGSNGLLYGGPLVAGVEVTVLSSESHTLNATPTQTAIEDGSRVTDHVILDPVEVTVAFAVTNAGPGADQARDVYESFKKLRDERVVLELITEHAVYQNIVITGVDMRHEAPFKGALSVTLKLRQIAFVELQAVGRDPMALEKGVIEKLASRQVDGGSLDAVPLD